MRARLAFAVALLAVLAAALWFARSTADDGSPAPNAGPSKELARRRPWRPLPVLLMGGDPTETVVVAPLAPGPGHDGGMDGTADEAPDVDEGPGDAEAAAAWLGTNASAAEQHVERFCAESRRVQALDGLGERPRTRDAAIYLAVRVDWDNGRVGLLHLPEPLAERLASPGWQRLTPADVAGLDLSWMQALLAYDHWTLSGDGPVRDRDAVDFLQPPQPDYAGLEAWVKLRLLQGLHEQDLAQASLEVRHLGALCASTGSLMGTLVRAAMFEVERAAWEAAGLAPAAPLPSAEDGLRLRHTALAGGFMLYPGVKREVRARALACTPFRCAALLEAIGATVALKHVNPQAQEDVAWLMAQQPCDRAAAERLVKGTPLEVGDIGTAYFGVSGVEFALGPLLAGGR